MSNDVEFDPTTNTLTVPERENVEYLIGGKVVKGQIKIKRNTTVRARTTPGRKFPKGERTEWKFEVSDSIQESPAESPSNDVPPPADPVEADVAGNTPESPQQQIAKANAANSIQGNRPHFR